MRCPTCGSENRDDTNQCAFCGQRLAPKIPPQNTEQNDQYTWNNSQDSNSQYNQNWQNRNDQGWQNQNNQGWQSGPMYNPYGRQAQNKNGMATLSMILALASIFTMCLFWPVSIGLDIAAIVLGIISLKKRQDGKGQAITGIVVGGIVLIACIAIVILAIYLINDPQFMQIYQEMYQQIYGGSL